MPKQTAKVAVSGGKKIKACGRTYFVADTSVRFKSNVKMKKKHIGNLKLA
jgi:hypothetical protein